MAGSTGGVATTTGGKRGQNLFNEFLIHHTRDTEEFSNRMLFNHETFFTQRYGGREMNLVEICDIASPPLGKERYDDDELDDDYALFVSGRFCDINDASFCVGGVVESRLYPHNDRWGILMRSTSPFDYDDPTAFGSLGNL